MKTKLLLVLFCFTSLPILGQQPDKSVSDPFKVPDAKTGSQPREQGNQEEINPVLQILLQEELFTLPRLEAHALLLAGLSDEGIHEALLKKLRNKTATLDKFLLIRGRSGQRSKVEQINEFPYPTDFDPPQVPQTLTLVDKEGVAALAGIKNLVPPAKPSPAPPATPPVPPPPGPNPPPLPPRAGGPLQNSESEANAGVGIMTTVTPTTFAVRNIGDTWEVDPVINEDGTVDVTVAPESVRFLGYQTYQSIGQPHFQTRKVNTALSGISHKPILVGTCSRACQTGVASGNQEEMVSLEFITPMITHLPAPEKRPSGGAPAKDGVENDQEKRKIANLPYRFQFELFSLPKLEAHALILERLEDHVTHARLQAMLKAKTAKLETVLSLRAQSAQRAKVQQIVEYPYGTDFDPPQIAQNLTIAEQTTLDLLIFKGGAPAILTPENTPKSNAGFGLITGLSPTTYTSRDVGESLELDPVVSNDGTMIDITLAPESVHLVGMIKGGEARLPIFETQKLNTAVTARVNVPVLVGTMSRPWKTGAPGGNEEDRVCLAFITGFNH